MVRHLLMGLAAMVLVGCATTLPPERVTSTIDPGEVQGHVSWLASPRLEGRGSRSVGAARARQYITSRFEALGLEPWPGEADYEQDFVIGRNVVGVLPGTDTDAGWILLCAHHDHLGRVRGEVYPGANDNASGVAVLLEVAERLMTQGPLRRTVVFASFDLEEQFLAGALIFAGRQDVQDRLPRAVINVDMIGRATFDTLADTLLLVGGRSYPALRTAATGAGRAQGLDVLPVGRELLGARSDHVAFEDAQAPVVMLTTGPFADYHAPTDTPEKIDVILAARAGRMTADLVRQMADDAATLEPQPAEGVDCAELLALDHLLAHVQGNPPAWLVGRDLSPLEDVRDDLTVLLANVDATAEDQTAFYLTAAARLLPLEMDIDLSDEDREWLMLLHEWYVRRPTVVLPLARRVVRALAEDPPGLLHHPDPVSATQGSVRPPHVVFDVLEDGRVHVHREAAAAWVEAQAKLRGLTVRMTGWVLPIDFTGTSAEVEDYLVLRMHQYHVKNRFGPEGLMLALIRVRTGAAQMLTYDQAMAQRLAATGDVDIEAWLARLQLSDNEALAHAASEE